MRFTQPKPLARSAGLLLEQIADETVAYDTENNQAHCLSALAAIVFDSCDGKTSIEKLAATAAQRLGEPVDVDQINDALAQLESRALLVADGRRGGYSRREVIRRSAKTGAVVMSAPLIASIVAPTPAAAVTGGCGEIACCPCYGGQRPAGVTQSPNGNGQDCCEGLKGQTDTKTNCNCVNAVGGCGKQCKSSGPALSEENCAALFPGTGPPIPGNASTICRCFPCTG